MKSSILLVVCLLSLTPMYYIAQNHINCVPEWDRGKSLNENRQNPYDSNKVVLALSPEAASKVKYLKMDFWFQLKDDGSGGFTETGDDNLDLINGYDFIFEVLNYSQSIYRSNHQLNIPPNNNIPVEKVPIRIMVNKIHFVRDSKTYYSNGGDTYKKHVDKLDSIFSCIFYNKRKGGSGYSSSRLIGINVGVKKTIKESPEGYYTLKASTEMADYLWVKALTLNHELGHGLNLDHTLLTGWGDFYKTSRTPSGSTDYGDGCEDTPSAAYMVDSLGLPPEGALYASSKRALKGYPNCNWVQSNKLGCSNNLMDYTGDHCLSPCQIERMVKEIAASYENIKLCKNVGSDINLSRFGYPQVSYYGKNITIEAPNKFQPVQKDRFLTNPLNANSVPKASSEERQEIYFSESVEINSFEFVEGDKTKAYTTTGAFEIRHVEPCP